ncbi:MAG: DNA polymerase III subunit delta' [Anaerovibrio sp.]|nr:DNA polymerase III subunit delta' [Anaerovibrio sp.]
MNILWNSIVGHQGNIDRLKLLCRENKVPHAMLFCGIDGIGKKKVAQALAGAILCHNPVHGTACGECPSCKALLADIHPDFFQVLPEVKAGSGVIRIDAIRGMQEKIARLPILSRQRVVIIDDAQTMNEAASNCLLKTIEEPGEEIYFILITNSVMALLDTIISRCTREEFAGLSADVISSVLEQQGISKDKADYLAGFADGSVHQAMLLNDEEGISLQQAAMQFFSACTEKRLDMEAVWNEGKKLGSYDKGQLKQWFSFYIMLIRDQLVLYSGSQVPLYNQIDIRKINDFTGQLTQLELIRLLKLAREYQGRLRYSVSLRLMMESFIIKVKDLLED